MRRNLMLLAVAAATLTAATPTLAQPGQSCFFVTQWNGWKAAGDHTIYLNVAGNRIYRLDMANACPELNYPDAQLINDDRSGSGSICSPMDLNLRVSEGHGIATPCIVSGITRLTPEQAAALPRNERP